MALTDKLTAIGDAIRGKTGGTEPLTLDQMATEIANISSGGGGSIDFANLKSMSYTASPNYDFIPLDRYNKLPEDFSFPAFMYVSGIEQSASNNMNYSRNYSGVAMLYTNENNEIQVKPLINRNAREDEQPFSMATEYQYINGSITAKGTSTYFRQKTRFTDYNITLFYVPKA